MNRSPIPWLGKNGFTWNPITGCTFGCDYCYARKIAERFGGHFEAPHAYEPLPEVALAGQAFPFGFEPTTYPHRLVEPRNAHKPHTIFVCSMGDLFDPAFPDRIIAEVIRSIAVAKNHTFVLLTKQAERMQRFMSRCGDDADMGWITHDGTPPTPGYEGTGHIVGYGGRQGTWPLPNLILGVTVTNQEDADTRIPLLLETPAAYRMVSVEPMLGPVDLESQGYLPCGNRPLDERTTCNCTRADLVPETCESGLDFVAIGAKTPGRPLHVNAKCQAAHIGGTCLNAVMRCTDDCLHYDARGDWLRELLVQCTAAGVPVNYKHGNTTPAVDGVTYDATLADMVRS